MTRHGPFRGVAAAGALTLAACGVWQGRAAAQPPPPPAVPGVANPSFNLINRAPVPVRELFVTPAGDANWGRDRLGGKPIPPGGGFTFRRRTDGNCVFDIRAVYADGRAEEKRGVNTCKLDTVVLDGTDARPPGVATLRLANRGQKPIVTVNALPAAGTTAPVADWGKNLAVDPIPPGEARGLAVPGAGGCRYDLRVTFSDARTLVRRGADLCRNPDLSVP